MSFLQAFNFSSPFQTLPNYGGYGVTGGGVVQPYGPSPIPNRFSQTGVAPTGASPLTYTTAANNLLVNQNPQSPATAAAAQLQIPQSIVPNYNPNAPTDYYGNPNENYANQQAPIPPEYQQQQQTVQQQQQIQQQQLQLQQQQLQLQQQQHQLQIQGHNLVKLKPHVLQVVPEEGQQRSRNRDDNKDGFDVIIQDSNNNGSAEQVASAEIDPSLPPTQQPRRGRRRNRKPPHVVSYAPVQHVEYYAPLGGHHVQLHSSSKKFSLHEVIDDPNAHTGQQTTQLNVNGDGQVSINPAGTRGASIPNIGNGGPNVNNISGGESNTRSRGSAAGPGPSEFGISGPQPQQQPPSQNIVDSTSSSSGANGNTNIGRANADSVPDISDNSGSRNADDDDSTVLSSDSNVSDVENLSNNNNNGNNNGAANNNQQSPAVPPTSSSSSPSSSSAGSEKSHEKLRVTPIQGPIYAKDGMAPVVPLYSYPSVKNGTFYQIPILWTALSYALGLEIHGEILRGLPCIKRLNQLYCPSAGTNYPLEKIEGFIDENKALIRRMYGDFIMSSEAYVGPPGGNTLRRSTRDIFEEDVPDLFPSSGKKSKTKRSPHHNDKHSDLNLHAAPDDDHITVTLPGNGTMPAHVRATRQTVNNRNGGPSQQPRSNRVDSCESTVEIVTPYWAANSGGKVRAIVNTQHFEQAIHQEVCRHTSTRRCSGDCGCEQKYKWHRLLAYDPDNDCRGIFMDWFLFPSCCVCRCNPQQQQQQQQQQQTQQ